MAFISTALTTLGITGGQLLGFGSAALGAVGTIAAGSYQAAVANMNADVADENAKMARQRAQLEAYENDMMTAGMLGEQEAAQSASGVSLTSRSAVLTRKAARQLGRRDTLNIRQAGEVEAYNYKVDAANQRAAGQGARMQAGVSALGQFMGATGNLIGGARSTRMYDRVTADPWRTKATNYRRRG